MCSLKLYILPFRRQRRFARLIVEPRVIRCINSSWVLCLFYIWWNFRDACFEEAVRRQASCSFGWAEPIWAAPSATWSELGSFRVLFCRACIFWIPHISLKQVNTDTEKKAYFRKHADDLDELKRVILLNKLSIYFGTKGLRSRERALGS